MKKIYLLTLFVFGCAVNDVETNSDIVGHPVELTNEDYDDPCLDSDSIRKGVIFKIVHARSSVAKGTYVNCYTSSGEDLYTYLTTGEWPEGETFTSLGCIQYSCETDTEFCSCQNAMEW